MNDSVSFWLVVYAACCAVAWMLWPSIQSAFGPDVTPYTNPNPYDHAGAARGGYSPYDPRGGR
jgi:hypothetical protein